MAWACRCLLFPLTQTIAVTNHPWSPEVCEVSSTQHCHIPYSAPLKELETPRKKLMIFLHASSLQVKENQDAYISAKPIAMLRRMGKLLPIVPDIFSATAALPTNFVWTSSTANRIVILTTRLDYHVLNISILHESCSRGKFRGHGLQYC